MGLDRAVLEDERKSMKSKHDEVLDRLRGVTSELEALRAEKFHLEKEAADARRLLDMKMSEEMESGRGRQLLDQQVRDLKSELASVQAELNKERQVRSDTAMVIENKISNLQREHDSLNMTKETIEKELYEQQDTTRRAIEARSQIEKEKRNLQTEVKGLRDRISEVEAARIKAESEIERSLSRQAKEKEARMEKDLKARDEAYSQAEAERQRLASEVARLTRVVNEQDTARQMYESTRRRADQENNQMKNRLIASENDNRVLQNKIQQKNLEISKANAKAGEQYRDKIVALTNDKAKADETSKKLHKQLEDSQLQIGSLEKQKEKLTLNLEDINHEVAREHKTTRAAEKASSQLQLQLAEANRNLEMERQLKAQAQANTRQIQNTLATTNSELEECHQQLLVLQKVFDPEGQQPVNWESGRRSVTQSVDLASKLEDANQALRVSQESRARAEKELGELRQRHQDELQEMDSMHSSSKKALFDEFNQNNAPTAGSPKPAFRTPMQRQSFTHTTPGRNFTNDTVESGTSDRTVDTATYQRRMDLASELEEVQNQLQLSEMRNKHLQAQIDRATEKDSHLDEAPSARRAVKLEKENNRLHDMLDNSAQKNSALEASMSSIELSMQEIQAKTHEELFDYINHQETSRKNLVAVHNEALNDLAWAKEQFDKLKSARLNVESELRETQLELDEALSIQQQDKVSRSQLLNEFADLQIRLDAENSKVADLTASMNLYKARSEEYFSKLEQAEISVLKSSRAEAFTRAQAREAEETAAMVMSERKHMESLVEDLQRQNQHFEEKVCLPVAKHRNYADRKIDRGPQPRSLRRRSGKEEAPSRTRGLSQPTCCRSRGQGVFNGANPQEVSDGTVDSYRRTRHRARQPRPGPRRKQKAS